MPPKQRSGAARTQDKTKSTSSQAARSEDSSKNAPSSSDRAQAQAQGAAAGRRRREVKWSPVFKKLGYVSLIFLVPAILNYAALNQEMRMLVPKGIKQIMHALNI